jgi:hypothetical protein
MLYTVKEDLDLVRDLKVTPRQLMFIKMLVKDHTVASDEWRRLSYAMSLEFQDLTPLSTEELIDLIARDIVIDLNKIGGPIFYDCYEINPKFLRKFTLKVTGLPTHLCDTYPRFFEMNGSKFNAQDAGAEEIARTYLNHINKDEEEHERIIDDIEWAKENEFIKMGIKKFVNTRNWLSIRELRGNAISVKRVDNGRIG